MKQFDLEEYKKNPNRKVITPEIVAWWRPSEEDSFKIAIMNNDTSLCAKVKYVHELQHALRLCGLSELAENLKVL